MQRGLLSANGTADLGRLAGNLLFFGGPYSNLEAAEALLAEGRGLGIPPDRTICTGDVVAYGADPEATTTLLRDAGVRVVMGNCEESLAEGAANCGCGFTPGSACDRLAMDWYAYSSRHLSAESLHWMAGLPRRIRFEWGGRHFAVVHGAPSRINRFLFDSAPAAELGREIELAGVEVVVAGHCGLPFTRRLGDKLWHNPGAIGLPANDGTPRVWYSLLHESRGEESPELEHRALDYDRAAAARKMRERGLPEGYAAALETGLWPGCDILPPRELAERGKPLGMDGERIALRHGFVESRPETPARIEHRHR